MHNVDALIHDGVIVHNRHIHGNAEQYNHDAKAGMQKRIENYHLSTQ